MSTHFYRIGTQGQAWGDAERAAWRQQTSIQRTYAEEVLAKLDPLKQDFDVRSYGALSYDPDRFPLFSVRTRNWDSKKPSVLITGGVHGDETSGVQGAILFLQTQALSYAEHFNIVVAPCVSPWGYERIQRWNANAVDPNRSFFLESGCEEAVGILNLVASFGENHSFLMHVDLHETTDTDETEFRPAKASRDGEEFIADTIPDGFYLVGDSKNPQPEWHRAMINAVRPVTHIAPPDQNGHIIGAPLEQEGVIVYPAKDLHLCSSAANASYATTTEVYPDSPNATDEQCNRAQVACLTGALDYLKAQM
jgi:hypothetical protein